MATRKFNLRALAVLIGCASLLPIACSGDDDSGNPTPGTGGKGGSGGTGGSGAKGGKGGSGGSTAGTGEEGGATTGGTSTSGGKGGSSATGGKGGSGAKGGSGGKGGSENNAGTGAEAGSAGSPEAGSGGTGGSSSLHACTADDMVDYNCGTTAHPVNIKCFADCSPTTSDNSDYFINHCPDGSGTLGGVTAACQPWTTTLPALGSGCKALGPGCTLPAIP